MATYEDLNLNKRLYRVNTDPNAYLDSENQVSQNLNEVDFAVGLGPDDTVSDEPLDPNAVQDGQQNSIIELLGAYYYRKTSFNNTQVGFRLGVDQNEAKFWFGNTTTYMNLDATPGSNSIMVGIEYQSSLSSDNIIIDPSLDEFQAYFGGNQTVSISGEFGIQYYNSVTSTQQFLVDDTGTTITDLPLNLSNSSFIYNGILQPIIFTGVILSGGTATLLPTGWSVTKTGTSQYTITHNLNTTQDYIVICTPISGHYRYQLLSHSTTDFVIDWEETIYGSDTFPVSGGAGGSVTVSGIRVPPNEGPLLAGGTDFQFTLLYYG